MIDDLEDRLLPFLRGRVRREQPSDPEMGCGAQICRYQYVGGFLDAVMDKSVTVFQTRNQLQTDRLPQIRVDLLLRGPVNDRKYPEFGKAEAGKLLQCSLGLSRQAGASPRPQHSHAVGVTLGGNAIEIPRTSRSVKLETEETLLRG